MFDAFVKQAQRLFSSKSNGGKQVPKLTDQLHTLKQVLLALAIVLVLGYSQFRAHFKCQAVSGVDEENVTNFCLINGTSTVVDRAGEDGPSRKQVSPHVGQNYVTNDQDSMVVRHLYVRDLWLILIVMAIFSFIAQRHWAQLFQNDVLQALLKLVGYQESQLVKAADTTRPFEMLSTPEKQKSIEQMVMIQSPKVSKGERVMRAIEFLDDHANIHDHKLDYYPNQLIYLLLTKGTASYKMTDLKLRRKLLVYSLCSTVFTGGQFLFPLIIIGNQYSSYGYMWARAALVHFKRHIYMGLTGVQPQDEGPLDYQLSALIFPLSVQCEYKSFGYDGSIESQITQCTAAIDEICSKIFPVIWWFVVINMVIEIYALILFSAASLKPAAASYVFSWRFWPCARHEADLIASFRHKRAQLQRERKLRLASCAGAKGKAMAKSNLGSVELDLADKKKRCEQKQLEAEDLESGCSKARRRRHASSYRCLTGRAVDTVLAAIGFKRTQRRRRQLESENRRDINIYHLLYLMHLRLGKSKSRTEEVIQMTARALQTLLEDMDKANEAIRQQLMATEPNGRPDGHDGNKQLSIAHQQLVISNHDDTDESCDELSGGFRSTDELANGSASPNANVAPNAPNTLIV